MAIDKAGFSDKMEAAVAGPAADGNGVVMHGAWDAVCWAKDANGQPYQVWSQHIPKNIVVQEGLAMALNIALGGQRATTNGPFMALHSVSANSTRAWTNMSSAAVTGYSASHITCSIASTNATAGTASASGQFVFSHAGTQTVSGACLLMYTSASCATNSGNDVRMYNIGTFSAAQPVISNNSLSVTVSLSATTS